MLSFITGLMLVDTFIIKNRFKHKITYTLIPRILF